MSSKKLLSKISKVVGISFTCLSIFILFPLMFFMKSFLSDSYEKYDYDQIKKNGVNKTAKVINIASLDNVNINGKNPFVITYQFEDNKQKIVDRFKTLNIINDNTKIEVGSEINIKYYNKESMPAELESFAFPFNLFYILPVIFLILGIAFWFVSYKIKQE